jgi:hypothetical protein
MSVKAAKPQCPEHQPYWPGPDTVESGFDKTDLSVADLLIPGFIVIKRVGLQKSTVYSAGYPDNKLFVSSEFHKLSEILAVFNDNPYQTSRSVTTR